MANCKLQKMAAPIYIQFLQCYLDIIPLGGGSMSLSFETKQNFVIAWTYRIQ